MNTTNGKMAEQSRKKFANALLHLMEQYSFKEITITQLAQEAELSRKTFYRLFTDKETLLSYQFENLYTECLEKMKSHNIRHYWDIVQCYFNFWEEHRQMLILFRKNALLSVLFDGAYQYSFGIFSQIRSQEIIQEFSVPLPYLQAYSIGGIHSMLLKWVENGMEIPSCELIDQMRTAFQSSEL